MKHHSAALLSVILPVLSGCASSLSGVGGTEHYACRAPEGAQCLSVSGVYANTIHGTAQRNTLPESLNTRKGPPRTTTIAAQTSTAAVDSALRSKPRQLRVWIAPWEDSDGDLHEAATLDMLVDSGHWLIEHVRPARQTQRDGAVPPVTSASDAATVKADSSTPTADRSVDRLSASPATSTSSDTTMTAQ